MFNKMQLYDYMKKHVLRSEGETAMSVSHDGSFFHSGPLTQFCTATQRCDNAHTAADEHTSMCV